jgi:pantetheine-phosphate adenylyltransferase
MNKKLNREIETIFLMANIENQIISSSLVKEIAKLGGDMDKFTTKSTVRALKEKLR